MLRSGPFSDERIIGLLNTRFVPFYFDLGRRSPAGDEAAREFVVAARKEMGNRSVSTPSVLLMTADGEVLGEASNYATEREMLTALRTVLGENPEFAKPGEGEADQPRLDRARIAHWLGDDDSARELLSKGKALSSDERLFLAQILRRAGKLEQAAAALAKLDAEADAASLTVERGLLLWRGHEYEAAKKLLATYPTDGPRAAEARYYLGMAEFHLGDPKAARTTWKTLVETFGENRWSYRADWAYSQTTDEGMAKRRSQFTTTGSKSLLGRHGYMGRQNPDLKPPR